MPRTCKSLRDKDIVGAIYVPSSLGALMLLPVAGVGGGGGGE